MTKGLVIPSAFALGALLATPASAETWTFTLDHDWEANVAIDTLEIETADVFSADPIAGSPAGSDVWEIAPTAGVAPVEPLWRPEPTEFEQMYGLAGAEAGRRSLVLF